MEERRFDELTRVLGTATSRRQVLKGLVGGLIGGALASIGVRAPMLAGAAALPTCNGQAYDPSTQCCEPAGVQPRHPIANLALCPNRVPHPGHRPSFNGCGPENGFFKYVIPNRIGPIRNIDFTPACNNHDICYDTCNSEKAVCDTNFFNDLAAACTAAYPGRGWYQTYIRTLCINVDARLYYLAVARGGQSAYEDAQKEACDCCPACEGCDGPSDKCCNDLCVDVSSDHDNCGDCGHQCTEAQICVNGTCQCPQVNCPSNQTLDSETCQCVGNGGGFGGCPPCQSLDQSGACAPDPSTDGQTCGNCGHCSGGTCVADPNRSCPTCSTCSSGGLCLWVDDNTPCGSNEVCCRGTCTAGTSCAPCPPGQHQCPADIDGDQTCCADGLDCCADNSGYTICGPTNGVCCPLGTTFQCGTSCCDVTSEQCLHAFASPGDPNSPIISACCPSNAVGLLPDGTCCPAGQQMCGTNNDVCCASGQQCTQGGGAYPDVLVCCPTGTMGVLPDGTCCPAGQMENHCSGGWVCCDVNQSDESCCGCAQGQVIQHCDVSDSDTLLVCCDPGANCC